MQCEAIVKEAQESLKGLNGSTQGNMYGTLCDVR